MRESRQAPASPFSPPPGSQTGLPHGGAPRKQDGREGKERPHPCCRRFSNPRLGTSQTSLSGSVSRAGTGCTESEAMLAIRPANPPQPARACPRECAQVISRQDRSGRTLDQSRLTACLRTPSFLPKCRILTTALDAAFP